MLERRMLEHESVLRNRGLASMFFAPCQAAAKAPTRNTCVVHEVLLGPSAR